MEAKKSGGKSPQQETAQWAGQLARRLMRKSNDVVKLAFLEGEELKQQLESLDLYLLSEVKRNANGTVELKLVDRVKALTELAALMGKDSPTEGREDLPALSLYRALECRAEEEQNED